MNQPVIKIDHGKAMTSSVAVADYFEREHNDVMKSIRSILTGVSEAFGLGNFSQSTYQNRQNKTQPCYLMTKSGFAMTALGFSGKKAIQFREAYITRFDEMEGMLHEREILKLQRAYVEQKYLPFDEPVIRGSVGLSDACKHLRILGVHLTLTPGQLKGRITRGELEGHQNERGHWRIYVDQVTKLATGH